MEDPDEVAGVVADYFAGVGLRALEPRCPEGRQLSRTPLVPSGPWRTRSPRACPPPGWRRSPRARWRSGSPPSTTCPSRRHPADRQGLARPPGAGAAVLPGAGSSARRRPRPTTWRGPSPSCATTPSSCCWRSTSRAQEAAFFADAERLVERYFTMEDPRAVRAIGLELRLEVARSASCTLRGIIDRLELDDDGELVVTDYKTGRAPMVNREQQRLGGVHFYAFLCEQVFGRRPAAHPAAVPEHGRGHRDPPVRAVRSASCPAAPRPCTRPSPGPAPRRTSGPAPGRSAAFCAFKPWCPAFGGDPERAAVEAPRSPAAAAGPGRPPVADPGVRPTAEGVRPAHPFGSSVARVRRRRRRRLRAPPRPPASSTGSSTPRPTLGDWSLIWHLIGVTQAARRPTAVPDMRPPLRRRSASSRLLVNQGVKRLFHRQRPGLRSPATARSSCASPTTSSFPSGHASAAFCAAVLLSRRQPRLARLWFGLAARGRLQPHLRAHAPRLRRGRRRRHRRRARAWSPDRLVPLPRVA